MKYVLFLILACLFLGSYAQKKPAGLHKKAKNYQVLFQRNQPQGVSCYRIPALATAPNGHLLAAADQRVPSCADLKGSKDINIVLRKSTDNGKNWSEIQVIVDFPYGKSASDPAFIVDKKTKEIFLFYNFMDLENEKNVYRFHLIKSRDNGKTWSKPHDITDQICPPEWHSDFKFITSGRGVQSSLSGELLHTLVNLQRGLFVIRSQDHGKNWERLETPIKPADESKIAVLPNGTWLINSRVNKSGMRYMHTSKDSGKSWETRPVPQLIDPGCNASFVSCFSKKKQKNLLLFVNAKHKKQRKNLSLSVSPDGGNTWSKTKTIYAGSAAYSSLTVLPNGDFGVLFEKDDYKEIVFVRCRAKWFLRK